MAIICEGLLEYLPAFGVICCVECRYAALPKALQWHLQFIYRLKIDRVDRFFTWKSALPLLHETERDIPYTSSVIPQLACLNDPILGYIYRECDAMSKSEKIMRTHFLQEHVYHHKKGKNQP